MEEVTFEPVVVRGAELLQVVRGVGFLVVY